MNNKVLKILNNMAFLCLCFFSVFQVNFPSTNGVGPKLSLFRLVDFQAPLSLTSTFESSSKSSTQIQAHNPCFSEPVKIAQIFGPKSGINYSGDYFLGIYHHEVKEIIGLEDASSRKLNLEADNTSTDKPLSDQEISHLANNEITMGDTTRPIVIMTYDDGGRVAYIEHIMSVYEAFNFRTTFFITGIWAYRNSDLVKEMIDRGFEIGCHGWDHQEMTALSQGEVRQQIADFLALMNQIDASYQVKYIRFPYGSRNQNVKEIAAEYGLQSVMWSCGSGGYDANTLKNVLSCLENGAIVLSHSTRWFDVYQTETILRTLVELGYEIVLIDDGLMKTGNNLGFSARIFDIFFE